MDDNMSKQGVKRKKVTILIVLGVIAVLIFAGYKLFEIGELIKEKAKTEQYLKEKYGKEFVVESIDYYYEYLGAPKEIKGIAYPKDDKELKFDVRKQANGKEWAYGVGVYAERYLNYFWDKQMKEKVKSSFGSNVVRAGVSAPLSEIEKNLNGKTLNIDEAMNLYKNKISLSISCGLFVDDTNKDLSNEQLDNICLIINSLKNDNFKNISLKIRFFNNNYVNEVKKIQTHFLVQKLLITEN